MRKALSLVVLGMLLLLFPSSARPEFNPAAYETISQADLVKNSDTRVGKKYQVTDAFKFCGSDFCVQNSKVKINTREYYCFALGSLSVVRMYVKKSHPDAQLLLKAKAGDPITVYGTFENAGAGFNYVIADHVVAGERKK